MGGGPARPLGYNACTDNPSHQSFVDPGVQEKSLMVVRDSEWGRALGHKRAATVEMPLSFSGRAFQTFCGLRLRVCWRKASVERNLGRNPDGVPREDPFLSQTWPHTSLSPLETFSDEESYNN